MTLEHRHDVLSNKQAALSLGGVVTTSLHTPPATDANDVNVLPTWKPGSLNCTLLCGRSLVELFQIFPPASCFTCFLFLLELLHLLPVPPAACSSCYCSTWSFFSWSPSTMTFSTWSSSSRPGRAGGLIELQEQFGGSTPLPAGQIQDCSSSCC